MSQTNYATHENHFIPSMDLLYIQRGADGFRHVPVPIKTFMVCGLNEYVASFTA